MAFASAELEEVHNLFRKQTARDKEKLEGIIETILATHRSRVPTHLSRRQRYAWIANQVAADIQQAAAKEDVHVRVDQARDAVVARLDQNGV